MLAFSQLNGDVADNANEERRDSKDLGDFLLTHGAHKQKLSGMEQLPLQRQTGSVIYPDRA